MSKFKSIGWALILGVSASCVWSMMSEAISTSPEERAAKKVAERKVREERAAHEAINTKVLPYVAGLKRSMRDPDSFVVTFTGRNEDASKVCIEYRARNGFGGYTAGFAVGVDSKLLTTTGAWNTHCANKTMVDLTTYARVNAG